MNLEKFRQLGLSEKSLNEIIKKGFKEPTEIQQKAIPLLLSTDVDIIGQAKTGTGKTAAFGLPIIEKISENSKTIQALILVPTRELANQVSEELNSFKGKKKLQVLPVYGGQSMPDQIKKLKSGVDIVVGTPGRILDHLKRKSIMLDNISFAVLDEADEMLNMGFIDDVEKILSKSNPDKRTFLFSATMPEHIMKIAKKYMHEYNIIAAKKDHLTVDETDQVYYEISQSNRFESLCRIIDIEDNFYGLIFCQTKVLVDELTTKLIDKGYNVEGIHGDLSQQQRERTLDKFRKKRVNILIATDVASRGIDISDLTHVINYSLPQDPESYLHRIGRTGRAGRKGIAISFISKSDKHKLSAIIKFTKTDIRKVKLPAIADIINFKKSRIMSKLNTIIEEGTHLDYSDTAMELLHENNPQDILAALLKYSFQNELDKKSYKEIKEIVIENKETTKLFVSIGKKDGLTPKKLIHLIQNESKVKAGTISNIKVKNNYSFLNVPFKEAEIIIKAFKSRKRKDKLIVYMANEPKKNRKNMGFYAEYA